MKRYIIFLLFFINFIPIYTDGNWFFDIGFRAFAYYDESENWNDNYYDYGDGFYEIGGNLCYDGNGDGYIDTLYYTMTLTDIRLLSYSEMEEIKILMTIGISITTLSAIMSTTS